MDTKLPPRTFEVLQSVIEAYIATGEPVASRAIALRRKDNLSPATIRNIMADLADAGFLDQPHTSAGRVPTAKAFRLYAQALAARGYVSELTPRLRDELASIESVEERIDHGSHVLTEMTRNIGIVAAIPASAQALDQIELLLLADLRVLMVVVTRDRQVRNQVVTSDLPLTQDELGRIRNYVNQNFTGWRLSDIRHELERRLAEESADYDSLLGHLRMLYQKGLLNVGLAPRVSVEGASNLLGNDLHLTKERLRELFRALEEKRRILDLLDQFLAAHAEGVQVQVGLGEAHPAMRELTLIGLYLPLPGGVDARLAVLGPLRMNYPRVIRAIRDVGEAFHTALQ